MRRSTPWVLGCCGPMLMIIVSSSPGTGLELGGLGLGHAQHAADLAQQLLGVHALARRRQLLGALVGLDDALSSSTARQRAFSTPLNCTGMRADAVVLAQRVAVPVLGHEDPGEVGVAVEADAEHVEHLALAAPRCRGGRRTASARPGRRRAPAGAPAPGERSWARSSSTTTSKRPASIAVGQRPGRLEGEVVDGGDVEAEPVALLVAQRPDEVDVLVDGRDGRRAGRGEKARSRSTRTPCQRLRLGAAGGSSRRRRPRRRCLRRRIRPRLPVALLDEDARRRRRWPRGGGSARRWR